MTTTAAPARADLTELLRRFAAPPAGHRPQVFMVWNGTVTRSYIARALREFRELGVGGVFIHPRPGLVTEYLSDEWFSLWRFAADEAERLGLLCHIYDENSYPAGFAGGHVPAADPLTVATSLVPRLHRGGGERTEGERWGTFVSDPATGRLTPVEPSKADEAAAGGGVVLTLSLVRDSGALWQGGFPYVDLTHPRTARAFIDTTYRRYAACGGHHLGTTCRYSFSDEPMLRPRGGWAMSRFLLAEFRREHGYDLMQHLAGLVEDTDAGRAVRFDYQMTVQRLLEENFARPMRQACGRLGVAWTGHFMEHEWPSPRSHPSAMSLLRYMHVPGNDLLGFQFDPNRPPADNAIWMLNLIELRSVARQTGAERTLCETCGGGGYGYGPRDMKACEDFALACGVTLVNPHLAHQTLTGARRYDWPQTISPHSPWFEAYRRQADHVARVQTALLAGRADARVLVLMPTTTAWLHHVPPEADAGGSKDKLESLRRSQCELVRTLHAHLIDFDVGDELVLRDLGRVVGGALDVGHARYDAVVIPPGMENALPSTLELLHRLPARRVLAMCDRPRYLAGRPVPEAERVGWGGDGLSTVYTPQTLVDELRVRFPPRLDTPAGRLPDTVLHLQRRLAGDAEPLPATASSPTDATASTTVHFLANPYDAPAELDLSVSAATLLELDTDRGIALPVGESAGHNRCRLTRTLPPRGHLLLVAGDAGMTVGVTPAPAAVSRPTWQPVDVGPVRLRRTAPNLLVLDYVDLRTAAGTQLTSVPCIRADAAVWHDHGYDQNPWRWAIQYRRTYLDSPFPEPSGFTLTYGFVVEPGVDLSTLAVAVERPELYDVRLNGVVLDVVNGEVWFDEETRCAAAGHAARTGINTLTLHAARMHPLCEIVPAYVLGEFAVLPGESGFVLGPPTALQPGDLCRQGLPFLDRGVVAELPLTLPAALGRLRVDVPAWTGSALGVELVSDVPPGKRVTAMVWATETPAVVELDGPFAAGRYILRLDLRGVLRNRLGPWHRDGLPIPWTWEAAPSPQPPGSAYRLAAWGLSGVSPSAGVRVFAAP